MVYVEERVPLILKNRGEKMFAVLHRPATLSLPPLIVVLHGFLSHKGGTNRAYVVLAEKWVRAGFAVLRFDMRGCGDSEGHLEQMTPGEYVSDLMVVLAYAEKEGYQRVGLFGSSLGGSTAVYGAEKSSLVRSLVLWAPVASGALWLQDWAKSHPAEEQPPHLGVSPRFREEFAALCADAHLEKLDHLPLLHFQGEEDEVLSSAHALSFQKHRSKATAETRFITYPHVKHSLGLSPVLSEVAEESLRWFKETL